MELVRVSPTAQAICEALARYRFLTITQMETLGLASRDTLYKTTRELCGRKRGAPIERVRFGATGHGGLPDLFHLRKPGADIVAQLGNGAELPNYPKSTYTGRAVAPHNMAVVDCHIALDQWASQAEAAVAFCHRDFDPGETGGRRKTTIDTPTGPLVPDMVFQFIAADGVARLCCLELYRDEAARRVVQSLEGYLPALKAGSIGRAHNFPDGVRVLAVFAQPRILTAVRQGLQQTDPQERWGEFFFAALADLQADFRRCWVGIDGKKRDLF